MLENAGVSAATSTAAADLAAVLTWQLLAPSLQGRTRFLDANDAVLKLPRGQVAPLALVEVCILALGAP
jgi:hypothetical protein